MIATMIEAELWVSFASLLRSYVAAATLQSAVAASIDSTDASIMVTAGAAQLAMRVDPGSGAGNWRLTGTATAIDGQFALLPDGRIALDDKTLDLDHAAIDFAAALMQAAALSASQES